MNDLVLESLNRELIEMKIGMKFPWNRRVYNFMYVPIVLVATLSLINTIMLKNIMK